MCHGKSSTSLLRIANSTIDSLSTQNLLQLIDDRTTHPSRSALLGSANMPVLTSTSNTNTRYYHLSGVRDTSRTIAFLASDSPRARVVDIPANGTDLESQFEAVSGSILRLRIWLNGGRGEGEDDDFRVREDGEGRWLVRLRTGTTPPGSALSPVGEDVVAEYTDLVARRSGADELQEVSNLFEAALNSTPPFRATHGAPPPTTRRYLGSTDAHQRL